MNKQLTQKQNLEELMRLTLINILSAKGVIYTYYKKQERELCTLTKKIQKKEIKTV